MRVLFLQQQPCVRALKYAVGLAGEVELGFAYRGRTLSELYGAGDELFETWYPLGDDPAATLPGIVEDFAPDVIHSHNLPDALTVLALDTVEIPVIHDVHDMQSLRRTPYEDGFPEPEDPLALERRAAEESAALITISPELVAELAARYRLPRRVLAYANYALARDLPATLPPAAPARRPAAARLPGDAVDQRRPLRPARPVRGDRRAGPLARRLPRARGARVPRDPGHPRPPDAAAAPSCCGSWPATTSAGRASTPGSTPPTSTPRCRTSSTSTSAAGCR